jgi:sugar lactone lactonase YvrE
MKIMAATALLVAIPVIAVAASPRTAPPLPMPQLVSSCGGFLEGIVVDAKGTIWLLDVIGGDILELGKDGTCIKRGRTGGMPNGAKFASDGTLTIADHSGLFSFNPATGAIKKLAFTYDGQPVEGLNDLAYDAEGGLYVTVPGRSSMIKPTGKVFYLAADGKVTLVAEGLAYPNGIAVSPDGEAVVVAEFAAKRILSLPSITGRTSPRIDHVFAYTSGGIGPDGIGFDPAGRLVTANFGDGTLHIFSATGTLQHVIRLNTKFGTLPTNLAFTAAGLVVSEAERGEVWQISMPTGNAEASGRHP